jgi:ABC-type Mn2+/Zn2+ transport system permease subunit
LVDPVAIAESQENGGNKLMIAIVIGIFGLVLGGFASYFLTRFANKFAVPILAAGTGFIATFLITKPIVRNNVA